MRIAFLSPRKIRGYTTRTYSGVNGAVAFVVQNSDYRPTAVAIHIARSTFGGDPDRAEAAADDARQYSEESVESVESQTTDPADFDHVVLYIPSTSYRQGLSFARRFPADRLTVLYCDCAQPQIEEQLDQRIPAARRILTDCAGEAEMAQLLDAFLDTGTLPDVVATVKD